MSAAGGAFALQQRPAVVFLQRLLSAVQRVLQNRVGQPGQLQGDLWQRGQAQDVAQGDAQVLPPLEPRQHRRRLGAGLLGLGRERAQRPRHLLARLHPVQRRLLLQPQGQVWLANQRIGKMLAVSEQREQVVQRRRMQAEKVADLGGRRHREALQVVEGAIGVRQAGEQPRQRLLGRRRKLPLEARQVSPCAHRLEEVDRLQRRFHVPSLFSRL